MTKPRDLATLGGGFTQTGTGAIQRTVENKLKDTVSVKDFGAVGNGITDDTAAFNAAIATGKKVFVPISTGGYVVNNVGVVTNMVIEGEKSGVSAGPTLIVSQNNAGAFRATALVFQISISNFNITTANTSVTGACAYLQTDKSTYTAYATFSGIETYTHLENSYDGFFIFTDWVNCRDGYVGNINTNFIHRFIRCIPAAWGQSNQSNVCSVRNCQVFNTSTTNSGGYALDIAYGNSWRFELTDFEALVGTSAIRIRGIGNVLFDTCWFERITSAHMVLADVSPAPNAQGSGVTFRNMFGLMSDTTSQFISIGSASLASFDTCSFVQIPAGITLAGGSGAAASITTLANNGASGTGAAGFFTGLYNDNYSSGKRLLNTFTPNGSSANLQLNGMLSASSGFLSGYNLTVNTTYSTIATLQNIASLVFIGGYETTGGLQGWWLVAYRGSGATVVASNDSTATNPTFQVSSGNLQMKTGGGTLIITTTVLN